MRILPVIDLLRGQVVRGVAGNRAAYAPIQSVLCNGSSPAEVAGALRSRFGFASAYVADLDAIAGREPHWQAYEQMALTGLRLWIDAGVANEARAAALRDFAVNGVPLEGIVLGLESLPSPNSLQSILELVGPARAVFSLDLKDGVPLASDAWRGLGPLEIACLAGQQGAARMLVLDLSGVGVGKGVPTLPLLRELQNALPRVQLAAGGGVRDCADLAQLAAAGVAEALVASALHDGRLTPRDLPLGRFAG